MIRFLLVLLMFPVTALSANNVLFWDPSTTTDVTDYFVYGSKKARGASVSDPFSKVATVPATAAKVPCPAPATTQCYTHTHVVPDDRADWIYYVTSVRFANTADEEESLPSNPAAKINRGVPNRVTNTTVR